MRFEVNRATALELYQHLCSCNDNFIPRLSQRVDLKSYSEKIAEKAMRFEAWNEQQLAGVVAAYFNKETHVGFITNVSTEPAFSGKGVASKLVRHCIEYAAVNNFKEVKLEVMEDNMPAVSLYHKFGFIDNGAIAGVLQMTLKITEQDNRSNTKSL